MSWETVDHCILRSCVFFISIPSLPFLQFSTSKKTNSNGFEDVHACSDWVVTVHGVLGNSIGLYNFLDKNKWWYRQQNIKYLGLISPGWSILCLWFNNINWLQSFLSYDLKMWCIKYLTCTSSHNNLLLVALSITGNY